MFWVPFVLGLVVVKGAAFFFQRRAGVRLARILNRSIGPRLPSADAPAREVLIAAAKWVGIGVVVAVARIIWPAPARASVTLLSCLQIWFGLALAAGVLVSVGEALFVISRSLWAARPLAPSRTQNLEL
jgi:hypothetical protein